MDCADKAQGIARQKYQPANCLSTVNPFHPLNVSHTPWQQSPSVQNMSWRGARLESEDFRFVH